MRRLWMAVGILTGLAWVVPTVAADVDPQTGLMWTDVQWFVDGGSWASWNYATELASDWVEDGYDDWRLPTIDELLAVVADGTFEAALIPHLADGTVSPLPPYGQIALWTSEKRGKKYWSVVVIVDEAGHVVDTYTELVPPKYYRTECFVRP